MKILTLLLFILLTGCATSQYVMPEGKIDDPLVQPDNLYMVSGGVGTSLGISEENSNLNSGFNFTGLIISESSDFDFNLSTFSFIFGMQENDYALYGATKEGKLYSALEVGYNPLIALLGYAIFNEPLHNLNVGAKYKVKYDNMFTTVSLNSLTLFNSFGRVILVPLQANQGFQLTPGFSLEAGVVFTPIYAGNDDSAFNLFFTYGFQSTLTWHAFENMRLEVFASYNPGMEMDSGSSQNSEMYSSVLKNVMVSAEVKYFY